MMRNLGLRPRDNGVIAGLAIIAAITLIIIILGCTAPQGEPHPAGWFDR